MQIDALHILEQATYAPGDQAPEGYLAWHEWADTQHKAGLRQKECGRCGLWRYPQELSGQFELLQSGLFESMTLMMAVCNKCAAPPTKEQA